MEKADPSWTMTPWKSNSVGVPFSLLAVLKACAIFALSVSVSLLKNIRVLGESRLETRKAGAAWPLIVHS